jgi:hypothetical protein
VFVVVPLLTRLFDWLARTPLRPLVARSSAEQSL